MLNRLNEQDEEIQKLKRKVNGLETELTIWKEDANEHIQETNKLFEENKQFKKKILEEIDLEIACIVDVYFDGRMSKEQYNGAIISLRLLKEKFE